MQNVVRSNCWPTSGVNPGKDPYSSNPPVFETSSKLVSNILNPYGKLSNIVLSSCLRSSSSVCLDFNSCYLKDHSSGPIAGVGGKEIHRSPVHQCVVPRGSRNRKLAAGWSFDPLYAYALGPRDCERNMGSRLIARRSYEHLPYSLGAWIKEGQDFPPGLPDDVRRRSSELKQRGHGGTEDSPR
jgi:hypothetical protein